MQKYLFFSLILVLFVFLNLANITLISDTPRGFLHQESEAMLFNYTDQRDLVQKIFDVNGTEWGMYQGRELSYLVDYFDYSFVSYCIKNGLVHFLSLFNYLGICIIGFLFIRLCQKYLGLDTIITSLLLALFLTSSSIAMSGAIYRSAKIGVGMSLMILLYFLFRNFKRNSGNNFVDYLMIFISSLAAVFFDLQGWYLIIGTVIVLTLLPRQEGFKRHEIIGLLCLSVLLGVVFNQIIWPYLIFVNNGYYPSVNYQALDVREYLQGAYFYLVTGGYLFMNNLKYVLGNSEPLLLVLLVFYFVVYPYSKFKINSFRQYFGNMSSLRMQHLSLVSAILLIFMNSVIFFRHPPLIWPDLQRSYYWIPISVIILFWSSLVVKEFVAEYGKKVIYPVLLVLLGCNLMSLPEHCRIFGTGHLSKTIGSARETILALQKGYDIGATYSEEFKSRNIYKYIKREMQKDPEYRFTKPVRPY